MFSYLIFIFTLLHYVLCDISCYDCPQADNTFEDAITSENIPTQLNNCSIHTEQLYCLTDIEWKQNPIIETSIRLAGGAPWRSLIDLPHSVEVNTYVPVSAERPRVKHFLRYICLTDECNRPANLKSLLESLTWTDKLEELEYLLESNGTFDARWCLFYSNFNQFTAKFNRYS
jgi:hypothetical protein